MKAKEQEDQDLVWSKKIGISPNLQNGVVPKYQRFYRRYLKPRLNKKTYRHLSLNHSTYFSKSTNMRLVDLVQGTPARFFGARHHVFPHAAS